MKHATLILMALAACGSSSGGSGPVTQAVDFDTFEAEVMAQGVTPVSFVPTGGSHEYAGLMQLNLPLGAVLPEIYEGQFVLGLAFDNAAVAASGTADGFVNDDGRVLTGDLIFGGGSLMLDADPDLDFLLRANLNGQLTDQATTYDLSAQFVADFYGMDATGFAGLILGGTIVEGANLDIFDGTLVGEKVP